MKGALQKLCLVIAGVVVALLIFELSIWVLPRSSLPRPLRELVEEMFLHRHERDKYILDPYIWNGIRPRTNLVVKHPCYSFQFKTNLNLEGIGFRGGSLAKPVWGVAVGDSMTFGVGVNLEETWIFHLAKALGREVVNLGVPGHGPPQYTRILKRYGLPMHPQVVFYGFYSNDLGNSYRFHKRKGRFQSVSGRRYLREHSVTFNLFRRLRRLLRESDINVESGEVEIYFNPGKFRKTLEKQGRKFNKMWQVAEEDIREAIRVSKEANVIFIVLYFPSREEVYWDLLSKHVSFPETLDVSRVRRSLRAFCKAERVLCLDLAEPLKQRANRGEALYFRIDGHWTKDGNRVVADEIWRYLTSRNLLDEAYDR